VLGLRKSQEAGLKRGVCKGDDGTTSGAVQDGEYTRACGKKESEEARVSFVQRTYGVEL